MLTVQEASRLSGVSVRTLHYYDAIGLLSPAKADNGYRLYDDADLERLQRILFYRVLRFPLKDIIRLMRQTDHDRLDAMRQQLTLLQQEQSRLTTLIATLEKTIQAEQGEINMTNAEKFEGFTFQQHRSYRAEAADAYGESVVRESERRQQGHEQEMTDRMNQVFFGWAENKQNGLPADDPQNVVLAEQLHRCLCEFAFDCTADVFASIGRGYVQDERFRRNIDQFGEGVSAYARDAILAYTKKE